MVNEHVRLVRPIGQGGMGSVWLGEHLGLDLPVAVKFISPELADNETALDRFVIEARTAAQLQHPNVVQIFDFGMASGSAGPPYIVMEYLEGEDLEQRIARKGCLEIDEVVSLVRAVAGVLEKAHELGIVHRDIKPENVFLSGPERRVKVVDFGVAKSKKGRSARATEVGMLVGTPPFMSPEQFVDSAEVDHRCDLWSLAVVAYYALTGRYPFEGDSLGALCIAIDRGIFKPPSRWRETLPPAVDLWFRKAFARPIEERFASAKAMSEALVAAVDARPRRRLLEEVTRAEREAQRGRGWIAVSALGLLVGGSLLAHWQLDGQLLYAREAPEPHHADVALAPEPPEPPPPAPAPEPPPIAAEEVAATVPTAARVPVAPAVKVPAMAVPSMAAARPAHLTNAPATVSARPWRKAVAAAEPEELPHEEPVGEEAVTDEGPDEAYGASAGDPLAQ